MAYFITQLDIKHQYVLQELVCLYRIFRFIVSIYLKWWSKVFQQSPLFWYSFSFHWDVINARKLWCCSQAGCAMAMALYSQFVLSSKKKNDAGDTCWANIWAMYSNVISCQHTKCDAKTSAGYLSWLSVKTKNGETARLMNHQINDQTSLSSWFKSSVYLFWLEIVHRQPLFHPNW